MTNFKRYIFIVLSLSIGLSLSAQSLLSLDSAIAITLKKNYNILISNNNYQVAENNHAPGVAGMLPNVGVTAGLSGSDNNIDQKFISGLEIQKNGATSTTISPGIGLTWTLFDGTKMFIAYNQLGLLRDEGMINMKAAIQDNISSVIEAYYNIVEQKELLAVMDSDLILYKQEVAIAKEKFDIGSGSKLDYLQAQVSYNAERSAYMKQQVNITFALEALNQLLELPVENQYTVADSITLNKRLIYDSLKKNMAAFNPTLLLAQTNMKVAANNTKEIDAGRLPSVNLGLNYGLSRTNSTGGFSLYNQSLGFSGGLTLTWTLFNGMNLNIQHENAELGELTAKFQYGQVEEQANVSLYEGFKQYETNITIEQMDNENLQVAKENVTIALAQFRIGTSNIIQLQQAQVSYVTANSQVIIDRYNTKVSETQLLLLAGQLVK